jgi:hypothetical protein
LVLAVLALGACDRDEIVNPDPDVAPGPTSSTLETLLDMSVLSEWTDTAFGGFARASFTGYVQVVGGATVGTSRGLIRFAEVDTGNSEVQTFDSARVVMSVDSAYTALPAAGTTILRLVELQQEWDVSATWELAVDTLGVATPWSGGPGGSLGPTIVSEDTLALIVTDTTTELPDSIVFWLGTAADSLLRLWADSLAVNTGLAVVVADSGQVRLRGARVHFNTISVSDPDTAVARSASSTAQTFIFDPTGTEDIEGTLRIGGVEAWRSYIQFVVPDSALALGSSELYPLRGSTINTAQLLLISVEQQLPPFRAEEPFQTSSYELVDDFLVFGPRTPVGRVVSGSGVVISPDSIVPGDTLRFDLTRLLGNWAAASPDSVPSLRFQIRPSSAASTFGFWEFGGVDGDPAFAPVLRIVFTPPVGFGLP